MHMKEEKTEKTGYEIMDEMGYDDTEAGFYRRYHPKKDYTRDTILNHITVDIHFDTIYEIPDEVLTEIDMIFMDVLEQLRPHTDILDAMFFDRIRTLSED